MNRRVAVLGALLLGLTGCTQTLVPRAQAPEEVVEEDQTFKNVRTIGDVSTPGPLQPPPISGVALVGNLQDTGGSAPTGEFRGMLEDQLRKLGVQNVRELLNSPKYSMVLVNSRIPVGTRKGDPLDLEVVLPQGSKTTSLRGGMLMDCTLMDYANPHNSQGTMGILKGHTLATGSGRLLVGFGESGEDVGLRRARIWGGGVSNIDMPFTLFLNTDQKVFASVANNVANRINAAFPDDAQKQYLIRQARKALVLGEVSGNINEKFRGTNNLGRGEAAQVGPQCNAIYVNVPYEYRLNPLRYLRVIRLIPLQDTADSMGKYRKRLYEMVLDPKDTIRAALRLEALGKESIPALKKGLASDNALVRFASAEALTYLGNTAGIDELARLAQKHETLRGHCLTAMASLNESCSQAKLTALMKSPEAQVRVGAFRALVALNDLHPERAADPGLHGDLLNDSFWLHHVAPLSSPMVHISTTHREEIVIFGDTPSLVPPLRINNGEFTITAAAGDERCTVSRFVERKGVQRKQCSFHVDAVLRTMAALGAEYPETVELLRKLDRDKNLTCEVLANALPAPPPVELLAACGGDATQLKDYPGHLQEVLEAQEDLGMVPSASTYPGARVSSLQR